MMTEQSLQKLSAIEIVKAHYDASAQGDIQNMMRDVAADVRWTEMQGFPCAGIWIGPSQVIDHVFSVLARDWIDYRFELEQLIDAGQIVIGLGNYRASNRATGKKLNARVAHIWQISEGKITAFEQFTDTLLVNKAMQI
jgi:ketosteroid isomerase-like protein